MHHQDMSFMDLEDCSEWLPVSHPLMGIESYKATYHGIEGHEVEIVVMELSRASANKSSGEVKLFKEVRTVTTEIGQNPAPKLLYTLPIEQQLELERHDRKTAHAQLRRADEKLRLERAKTKELRRQLIGTLEVWDRSPAHARRLRRRRTARRGLPHE